MGIASVRSDGDLEIVILHEAHEALADLIGPDLYEVRGAPPAQEVWCRTESHFNLFIILVAEFLAEGHSSAFIDDRNQSWSLLKGLRWLCEKYPSESSSAGLDTAVSAFEFWIDRAVPTRFWCPEVNTHVEFNLSNRNLIWFGANAAKHNLLRLSQLLGKLDDHSRRAGQTFSPQELSAVLNALVTEVRSRLAYHATYIVELLGNIFFALNEMVRQRFAANPTNRTNDMVMPEGVTSDVFRDLYGSVLVFKRYTNERIRKHTPTTNPMFQLRYQ